MSVSSEVAAVTASPGFGRTTSRSGRRRSIATNGRSSNAWSCCNCISRSSAATSWPSGSITSVPLFISRFQRRSPTRTAAITRFCKAGRAVSASSSAAAASGAPRPDDQWQIAEIRHVLVRDDVAGAVDQHEFAVVLPDRERAAFVQVHHDGAGQTGARRWPARPRSASRSACARASTEKPRIGSPLVDAERGAQQRFRRVLPAFDDDVVHAQPGECRQRRRSVPAALPASRRARRTAAGRCSSIGEHGRPGDPGGGSQQTLLPAQQQFRSTPDGL